MNLKIIKHNEQIENKKPQKELDKEETDRRMKIEQLSRSQFNKLLQP